MRIFIFLFISFLSTHSICQEQTVGVFLNTPDSYNGYTLFSSNKQTYLMDNCGYAVNIWDSQFSPGSCVYLLENGNLLRAGRVSGTINGGGIGGRFELFSWDNELLWSYKIADNENHAHHDIEPLPNGNFLALVWNSIPGDEALELGRQYNKRLYLERIVEIKMIGTDDAEIVWEWHIKDHLVQDVDMDLPNYGNVSESYGKMDFNYLPNPNNIETDWIHLNAIDYNPELDQIAVSSRTFSEIWVIDHSTTTEEAATSEGGNSGKGGDFIYRYGNPQVYDRGTNEDQVLFNQHNIEWILEGSYKGDFTAFNNNYQQNQSSAERWTSPWNGIEYEITENQPFAPSETNWTYTNQNFHASRISSAQQLPNNNMLICEGTKGHFFEVTEEGELVWDYINPVSFASGPIAQGDNIFQNSTFRARRYSTDYKAFEDRDLTPIAPIELEPTDTECLLYDPNNINELDFSTKVNVLQNPFSSELTILAKKSTNIYLYNKVGQLILSQTLIAGANTIDTNALQSGLYYIKSLHDSSPRKIIKI